MKSASKHIIPHDEGRIVAIGPRDTALILRFKESPKDGPESPVVGDVDEEYHLPKKVLEKGGVQREQGKGRPGAPDMTLLMMAFFRWCSSRPGLEKEFAAAIAEDPVRAGMEAAGLIPPTKKQGEPAEAKKQEKKEDNDKPQTVKELFDETHDTLMDLTLRLLEHEETNCIAACLSLLGASMSISRKEMERLRDHMAKGHPLEHIIPKKNKPSPAHEDGVGSN